VAIVCYLQGEATVQDGAGDEPEPLVLFDWLPAGTVVQTGALGRVILALAANGSRFELGPATRAVVSAESIDATGQIRELPPVPFSPELPGLASPRHWGKQAGAIRLRGTAEPVGLYPSHGATLLADQPVLLFPVVPETEKYRVEIEDEWGNNIFSVETRETRLDLSPGILKSGAFYYWRVRTISRTRPSTYQEAIFATLGDDDVRRHNELRQQAAGSEDPGLLLLLAWLDMELGLRREACQWLNQARHLDPANTAIRDAIKQANCAE
jgi:hypothetical protein